MREEEAVELIDIGGPALLRAAAKNYAHVAPVCRPGRYSSVLGELRAGGSYFGKGSRAAAAAHRNPTSSLPERPTRVAPPTGTC
ncbi:MAG: hypothetical protein H0V84_04295 [Actinobacteria bacterium]|nr:hypothetical protein [Actinomycetota bacterium]